MTQSILNSVKGEMCSKCECCGASPEELYYSHEQEIVCCQACHSTDLLCCKARLEAIINAPVRERV